MAAAPLFGGFSVGESIAFNVTAYCPAVGGRSDSFSLAGGETARQRIVRSAGVWSDPIVTVSANTIATTAITFRSRVNGANGGQTITIPAGSTGSFRGTGSDTLAAGDKICWQMVTPNTSGAITVTAVASAFTATTNTVSLFNNAPQSVALNAITRYFSVAGDLSGNTTETNSQIKLKTAGTLKNFGANVSSNARAVVDTFTVYVNGSPSTITIATTASTASFYEDTTHTVSIAVGDTVSIEFAAGASASALTVLFSLEFETTDGKSVVLTTSGNNTGANLTRYKQFGPQAGNAANFTTETPVQIKSPLAGTLSLFTGNVLINTVTAASTVRPRLNTANGTLVFSVPSSTTGYHEDTTHSDAVAVDDLLNLQIVTGATGTNFNVGGMSFVWTPKPVGSSKLINQSVHRSASY